MFFRLGVLATLDPVSSPVSLGDTMRAAAAASGRGARIHRTPVSPQPPSSSLPSPPVPSVLVGRSVGRCQSPPEPRCVLAGRLPLSLRLPAAATWLNGAHTPRHAESESHLAGLWDVQFRTALTVSARAASRYREQGHVSARDHTHAVTHTHTLLHTHLRSSSLSPPLLQHG